MWDPMQERLCRDSLLQFKLRRQKKPLTRLLASILLQQKTLCSSLLQKGQDFHSKKPLAELEPKEWHPLSLSGIKFMKNLN
jgi:hypothetical protein